MPGLVSTTIATVVLVAGCSAAPSATETVTKSSSAAASPTSPASPSATPVLDSTTEDAEEAPAGSILVDMTGPPPRFEPDALTAAAGDVVFFLDNLSPGIHNLAIGHSLDETLVVSSSVRVNHSAVFTVRGLERGEYVIWCAVDNHAAEGMVGTLTVE